MNSWQDAYRGLRVTVTGGLGFLGSNLAHALVRAGAEITVLDGLIPGCGGKLANLSGIEQHCRVMHADLREGEAAVAGADIVFNLAGEISHGRSMTDPLRDGQLNTVSQLQFLSQLARLRPGVRVVYAGTRQVYGVPRALPVDEDHPIDPVDFNGIHKYAATMYHMLYSRLGQLDAVVLRLSNVYGPRMALDVPGQGFLGVFLRRALMGEDLAVYQPGDQLRDPIYVDDAVDAFLAAGAAPALATRSFNLGGAEALSLERIAATIAEAAETGSRVYPLEFPARDKAVDIGSYVADWSRARRLLGWQPRTSFAEGVERTLAFYRNNWDAYLPEACPAVEAG